jgi:hypothetical protein
VRPTALHRVGGLALVLAVTIAGDAAAGTAAAVQATRIAVDLGFGMGKAGGSVSVPLALAAPDAVEVATTVNEVTFPTRWLSFAEARAARDADVDVTAAVRPAGNGEEQAIVTITVTAQPGRSLPNGLLANLAFTVAADAAGPHVVKLANVARAFPKASPGKPLDGVGGKAGEVEVLPGDPTVIACFFYMH